MSATQPLDVRVALHFLRGLRDHNDRAWFAEHRAVYDATIKPGFADFVAGLLIAAARVDERFAHVDPRACIFRIHRDIRFAKDRSPYKPYLSAFLSPRGWRGSTPGFYVALEPGGQSVIAAGVYVPEKAVLAAVRRRLADGDREFDRIVRAKRLQPYLPIQTDPLVRMPVGFDRAHPRGELLRARRYMVRRTFDDQALLHGDAFGLFRAALRDTAPFVRWLDGFVTPAAPADPAWDG